MVETGRTVNPAGIHVGPFELVWSGLNETARRGLDQARHGVMGSVGRALYQAAGRDISTRSIALEFDELPSARWTRSPVSFSYGDDGSYRFESNVLRARITGLDSNERSAPITGTVAVAPDDQADPTTAWKIALRGATNLLVSTIAPAAGALMVHGCAMVSPESRRALLFVGPGGAGKSTMVSRLHGWRPLGDDRIALWFEGGRPRVAGTPFISKNWLPCWGEPHELAAIVALEPQSEALSMEPLTGADAYATGVRSTFLPADKGPVVERAMELIETMVTSVPVYTLYSNLDHDLHDLLGELL